MTRLLIAEDERRISDFLVKGLSAQGYAPTATGDGDTALALALTGEFALLVLDLGLPVRDGFEVLRELRRRGSRLPVVVLTARNALADIVTALDGGADDYLAKPFRLDELLARIRLRLRQDGTTEQTVLTCGPLTVDLLSRRVLLSGRSVELTAREFSLLTTLLQHPDQVLSREQLLSLVWGYDHDPGSNVVDVYVRYLRKKLGVDRIETVRSVGYRLRTGSG